MLLAIDIGNTNIVFGVHDGQQWIHHWRVQTVRNRMPDEYAVLFQGFLQEAGLKLNGFERVVLSSVVPQLTQGITGMVAQRTGRDPLVIRPTSTRLGLEIRTDQPDKVGTDLLANAVAAYERCQCDCIVVDFGTATTFTVVARPGVFMGAAIAPGLNVALDALVSRTAQLPQIELVPPPSPIGRNTVHAMQSGLVLGYVGLVEGLVTRIRREVGEARVIATGGLSSVIGPLTECVDEVDPWLTLDGLRLIAERN